MLETKEKILFEKENSKIQRENLEVNYQPFEKDFLNYKKFNEETTERTAKTWGFHKKGINLIQREIDVILYQIEDEEGSVEKSNFELGWGN
jgi:hypothetical protein